MVTDLMKAVLGALLAAVGAWVGGHFAVKRQLDELRSERAFDRRLVWYESTVKALASSSAALTTVMCMQDDGFSEDAFLPVWEEAVEASKRLSDLAAEARLYATPNSATAMETLVRAHVQHGREIVRSNPGDLSSGWVTPRASLEQLLSVIRSTQTVLSNEVRQHLSLEPLSNSGTGRPRDGQ